MAANFCVTALIVGRTRQTLETRMKMVIKMGIKKGNERDIKAFVRWGRQPRFGELREGGEAAPRIRRLIGRILIPTPKNRQALSFPSTTRIRYFASSSVNDDTACHLYLDKYLVLHEQHL
ncbi:hypothetical protein EJ04DRAFT_51546 [Polyplosphaeria fusca]|uniref:Uncharacterized protein n=1 Tax=Polyplosphaeria fusca TaxID=682080 RepID=A0A9P4V6C9_9PLEO|nr:hypothetical protein EJ04DRAFT_51546 [Polyplosphaeria fusca]